MFETSGKLERPQVTAAPVHRRDLPNAMEGGVALRSGDLTAYGRNRRCSARRSTGSLDSLGICLKDTIAITQLRPDLLIP